MSTKTKFVRKFFRSRFVGNSQLALKKVMYTLVFGPVALGTNRCGKDLPALLGCAEEGLDEGLTLG